MSNGWFSASPRKFAVKPSVASLGAFATWSPAILFGAGANGAWYDPSDLSSMFQDAEGSVPAAVNQPVGLLLDKKSKLFRGGELIANPKFDTADHWGVTAGISIGGGKAIFASPAHGNNLDQPSLVTTNNQWYELLINLASYTSGALTIYANVAAGAGAQLVKEAFIPAVGLNRLIFRATATGSNLALQANAVVAGAAIYEIDSVSLRPLNGNHLQQATATARPVLKLDATGRYYLDFDGIDDRLEGVSWASFAQSTLALAVHETAAPAGSYKAAFSIPDQVIYLNTPTNVWGTHNTGDVLSSYGVQELRVLMLASRAANDVDLYTDAFAKENKVTGTVYNARPLTMGAANAGGAQLSQCHIYGALAINRVLNAREILQLRNHLVRKSGAVL
jgi:hypothetical protein